RRRAQREPAPSMAPPAQIHRRIRWPDLLRLPRGPAHLLDDHHHVQTRPRPLQPAELPTLVQPERGHDRPPEPALHKDTLLHMADEYGLGLSGGGSDHTRIVAAGRLRAGAAALSRSRSAEHRYFPDLSGTDNLAVSATGEGHLVLRFVRPP